MAFSVIEGEGRTFWCATDSSSTYYVGQIVSYNAASKAAITGTVAPLAVPNGVADTNNFQVPAGVVVAINDRTPKYNASNGLQTVTGAYATQAAILARDWTGAEGMYVKGDPQVLVQIVEITPDTVIRGSIYNTTYGVAPNLLTSSVADTTGFTSAGTTNTCEFTPTANTGTIYCRTGVNAGLYRVTSDASATAPAVTTAFPRNVAIGDTFVRVPLKQGLSHVYIAGPGLFIDSHLGLVTHTFQIFVYNLNLSVAGSEYADFRFSNPHFDVARA